MVSTTRDDEERLGPGGRPPEFGIIGLDVKGRIRSWNVGAERILAYRPSEVIGEHCSVLFSQEDRTAGWPEYELRWAAGVGCAEHTRWHRRKGGAYVRIAGTLTAIRDDRTRLLGYCKVILPTREQHLAIRSLAGYPDPDAMRRSLPTREVARQQPTEAPHGLLRRMLEALGTMPLVP